MGSEIPVPVLNKPHWRVNFRPEYYEKELIGSLAECFQIIEQTKVRLRGWDYPHLSRHTEQREYGKDWVGSWSLFGQHSEYWRFYQSGQFLHFLGVRESVDLGWRQKLENLTKGHLEHLTIDWTKVPGYISILNFLYTVTEIFEFAARMCQKGVYKGKILITIEIKGIKGFILTTEWNRAWFDCYAASEDILGKTWELDSTDLVTESPVHSLNTVFWFFERFGWLDPAVEVFREDQENFLKGRL
ncbi:MAG: hypothetical protein A2W61_02320 [Deltaproteobacteria bacterium RIFCSPLOWO2_01_44_7]|nr:MAG: hypothetical protein A2712_05100 [Deltaproteobacteria bacterium RIFCSPHIGHO2_01_FULL_43_49]OGQ15941.1 MAG: hypothetical protein A3D22_07740 [Deltaproteobacteria bacterium RIFCSPHIGHO2_02_FULL_44_53]OGQ29455.1 MAG: hypothetical protein A3D98_00090 [Deltaproteobacteria bacterium RIFCSPHIGHO2_12_FULL_44_21]OGQ30995.1 MAG: hypothetical protein A2979_02130 [Deltaproteobacteria bacterium RIFCSPLOWO2_01_FULL_45_74]OGQ37798.1 MAG: hypothetical protein A2W61_02320 [Deltaproteobacteria bacterium 